MKEKSNTLFERAEFKTKLNHNNTTYILNFTFEKLLYLFAIGRVNQTLHVPVQYIHVLLLKMLSVMF